METIEQKAEFLQSALVDKVSAIDPATRPAWGKMNVPQMIEHLAGAFRQAYGVIKTEEVLTPAENIPRMQAFLQSEKPFRENTPNALLPDEPLPPHFATVQEAIADLQSAVVEFFAYYRHNEGATVRNPFFGDLDYDLQVQLLYKHATHHLRQFGA